MTVETLISISHNSKSYSVPTGLFINNEFISSSSTLKCYNPSTGEYICDVYEASSKDVDVAVKAAQKAFKSWKTVGGYERGECLRKLADLVESNADELADLESMQNGKPRQVARYVDLNKVIKHYRYYSGWADKNHGKVMNISSSLQSYTIHEPYGVVGQIIPWNVPLLMMAWKLAPALAAGNVIVLKTSEKTPLSALKFCQLISKCFPPGVVNVLSGGPQVGEAISRHPNIVKVAFTGSVRAGRKVAAAAAESNLKKVTLELGGKSANIVFPDANLDKAVEAAYLGIYFNGGQVCCAGSRLFVHEDIYDSFIQKFIEKSKKIKIGDPFDSDTELGPIVDKIQLDSIMN
ncbi:putative aldehyde dehydrogenase, partial [Globomyces pollinis-pini]